jgi:hypothetical protein
MIILEDNCVNNVVPEGRVATRVFILVLRHEQTLTTADAAINSSILGPPVLSSEWSLSAAPLSDIELLRRQARLKFLLPFAVVFSNPALESLLILEFAWRPAAILGLENVVCHRAILIHSRI